MPHVFFLGFLLSLLVVYWPGAEPPSTLKTWLSRLWMALALSIVTGLALAYFNVTKLTLPNGGYKISYAAPFPVPYITLGLAATVGLLSLIGIGTIVRGESRRFQAALVRGGEDAARAKSRFVTMGLATASAALSFAASWLFAGPLVYTSADGYSNILPFALGILTFAGFIVAIGWFWNAAKLVNAPSAG